MRKALIVLKMRLARFWGKAEQTDVRLIIGASILILASVLYLGQYFSDAWFCLLDTVREAVTGRPVEWQCVKGVVRDLREDNTAATVILAIAAAVLASAWSSGSNAAKW